MQKGKSTITLSAESITGANNCDLAKLSIPESNACLTIGGIDYKYDSFEVSVALDGTYTYTFTLSENLDATSTTNIEKAYKKGDSASIGDSDMISNEYLIICHSSMSL